MIFADKCPNLRNFAKVRWQLYSEKQLSCRRRGEPTISEDLLKFLAAEVKLLSEMGAGVMNKQKVDIRELKHFSEWNTILSETILLCYINNLSCRKNIFLHPLTPFQ